MFLPEKLAYSIKMCRLIMAPVLLEDSRAWCLYTFDRLGKVLIVLDPVHNLQDIDMLARLHAQNAELLLEGLKLVGQTLADGFTINRAECDIEYNQGMHVPCSIEESGIYIFHYAKFFTGEHLVEDIDDDGLVVLRKRMFYDVMLTRGNVGKKPGFMLTVLKSGLE